MSQDGTYENPAKKATIKAPAPATSGNTAQNDTGTRDPEWHKSGTSCSPHVPKLPRQFGRLIAPDHKRLSRMLGYCLTLGTSDGWTAFSGVAAARLSEEERAGLAFASLQSLPHELAELTAGAALGAHGAPRPAFAGGMGDARSWATFATRAERKAYALAAFEAMDARDQSAFFDHVQNSEAVA